MWVDAQPEGIEDQDQLPLPPVAGEVSFQGLISALEREILSWRKMSALRFQLGPLLELLGAVEAVKAQS